MRRWVAAAKLPLHLTPVTGGALSRQKGQRPVAGGFELPVGHGEFDVLWLVGVEVVEEVLSLGADEYCCGRRERSALAGSGKAWFAAPRPATGVGLSPTKLVNRGINEHALSLYLRCCSLRRRPPALVVPAAESIPPALNHTEALPTARPRHQSRNYQDTAPTTSSPPPSAHPPPPAVHLAAATPPLAILATPSIACTLTRHSPLRAKHNKALTALDTSPLVFRNPCQQSW